VRLFNGVPGDIHSFDLLHEFLELQPYRLSFWRTATHEINYRRLFDINYIEGIRVEEPEAFQQIHALIRELIEQGDITGLRLDHVDGLFDPAGYLDALSSLFGPGRNIYLVVEKILSAGESLPLHWKTHGTTGYEFLNELNGLYVDTRNGYEFRKLYHRFTGRQQDFLPVLYRSKKLIIATSMASELNVLAHELNRISEGHRRFRDFTLDSLQSALLEVVACFPVYRTYVGPSGWSDFDDRCIDTAISQALRRNPAMEPSIFRFIGQMLRPADMPDMPDDFARRVRFAMKFQQYTPPVHAKGVEDTAFYRYAPLLSLNEVGGEPARFGRSPGEFHHANQERLRNWPLSMLTTSTHDSKRGEDARARINVLSEMPNEWRAAISRWARANASARTMVGGDPAPERSDEYLFYQALLGSWPAGLTGPPEREFVDRMRNYIQKALKEKKVHTSWINPSKDYDDAASRFVERALAGPNSRSFLPLFLPFQQRIARFGMVNSLSQLVLKIASPGVPDFYRGSELWDLNLVDPDNRRLVDFRLRERLLEEMEPLLACSCPAEERIRALAGMVGQWEDGRIKLYFTAAGLRLRRRWREVFIGGQYIALQVEGSASAHLVAFARVSGERSVIALAPRLVATLCHSGAALPLGPDVWGDTRVILPENLSQAAYRNVLTGKTFSPAPELSVAQVLQTVPAAILIAGEGEEFSG
jgi:(1->4)-alpha-D-glucan 1-alpha-D-glucosylmutase